MEGVLKFSKQNTKTAELSFPECRAPRYSNKTEARNLEKLIKALFCGKGEYENFNNISNQGKLLALSEE
jgi:hypothetical protein